MTFAVMKTLISTLQLEDHKTFVEALISIETGNVNKEELDVLYDRYMDSDIETLINPMFYGEE